MTFAAQIVSVLPLAAVHTLGNLLTNVSLGHVAVSFTHTIKARHACWGPHDMPCKLCSSCPANMSAVCS